MAELLLKLDSIAQIRSARNENYPDPVAAAVLADLAGIDGIAVHLRKDQNPVNKQDVDHLKRVVLNKFVLEIASTEDMVGFALEVKPDLVTLVPENAKTGAFKKGMDLVIHKDEIADTVHILHGSKIPVNILIDPYPDQVKLAHQTGADEVEIFTETFCRAIKSKKEKRAFSDINDAVKLAHKLKLTVNAGCGLCYNSIKALKGIKQIDTFIIGNSIISRGLFIGLEAAIREMIDLVSPM